MPKSRSPHLTECRQRMVDLVQAGRNPDELAGGFGQIGTGNWNRGQAGRPRPGRPQRRSDHGRLAGDPACTRNFVITDYWSINKRAARVMKLNDLVGIIRRRKWRTTKRNLRCARRDLGIRAPTPRAPDLKNP